MEATGLEKVIADLLSGQYNDPIQVVAFNIAGKWSQDASADIANELRRRCELQTGHVPFFLQEFVERNEDHDLYDIQLPLPMRLV